MQDMTMVSSSDKFRGQRGVSLIELLVVMVIISIVAAMALMQRGSANEQFKRQNVAGQLKVAFERARFDSVKRRAIGSVLPASVTVTASSFTLRTYNNDVNGLAVANDQVTPLPTGVVIARYDNGSLPLTINFNMRGETATSPAPQFYVCNGDCGSAPATDKNIVLVTPTGTVNLLPGGSGLPTFGVPSVTNVSAGSNVNPDAVLP